MTKRYKQSGRNSAYPEYIEVWEYGVGSVPDWISDKSKVTFGNVTLETHDTSTGGVEIIDSTGTSPLIRLGSKKDLICREVENETKVFVLTRIQLDLLYKLEL